MAFPWKFRKVRQEEAPSRPIIAPPPEEFTAATPPAAELESLPSEPLLPSAEQVNDVLKPTKSPVALPTDPFSLSVFVALKEGEAPPSTYRQVLALLEHKKSIELRLKGLASRIEHLKEDATVKADEFDELRFEKHLESLAETEDYDAAEAVHDSLDAVESLPEKREKLKSSIIVLAQLELSRAQLHRALAHTYETLLEELEPVAPAARQEKVVHLVREHLEQIQGVENSATSDGEHLSFEEDVERLEELFEELEEVPSELAVTSTASAFTLEK